MTWYLRTMGDQDTHRGQLRPDGKVAAGCGLVFTPAAYLPRGLPGEPADPVQACLACCKVVKH